MLNLFHLGLLSSSKIWVSSLHPKKPLLARLTQGATAVGLLLSLASNSVYAAPNSDFAVTTNTGLTPLNLATIYPGEATSLRITLRNGSTVTPITGVNFVAALPTTAVGGLRVNGAVSSSCGGTLTTVIGEPDIALSNLIIPVKDDNIPSSGECYLDIPITAWSSDGNSTSHSFGLSVGSVFSDNGENSSGGPQAITVRGTARPTWAKGFLTSPVFLGGATSTLRITVTNPNSAVPMSLTNFGFTDIFPTAAAGVGGAVIEPTGAPATGTCVAAPVNANVVLTSGAAAQVAVSGGTLAASSCTIDIPIQARHTAGAFEINSANTILASSFTSNEGLQPSSNTSADIIVRSPLAVTKSFANNVIASGQLSSFTITLSNSSTSALVVDTFSDSPISTAPYAGNLTVNSVANSCGGNTAIDLNEHGFEVSNFTIPASGNCVLTVSFRGVTSGGNTPTSYNNVIAAGAVVINGQPNIISQPRTASVIVADRLRVLKTRSPANVAPGNPVNYQVTIQNFDEQPMTNVAVADNLQNGATLLTNGSFAPSLTAGCGPLNTNGAVAGDSNLLFTIPTVAARTNTATPGSCTISFWAMTSPTATSRTDNQIGICAVQVNGDSSDCNGSASQNVYSSNQAVITFAKTFDSQNSVNRFEGTVVRLRLQVSNFSDNPLTTVAISDTLPIDGPLQQLRIASPANISNTCGGTVTAVPGNTSIMLNNGGIPARNSSTNQASTCELAVDVVGPAGNYHNTATVSALQTNADNTTLAVNANDSATVIYSDALTSSKSFSPTSVGSNGHSTARIRIGNLSTSLPITDIAITDDLPPGMTLADPTNAYTTCNGTVILNAVAGDTSINLSGANLAATSSCDLLFDVIATGNASWTNIINPGQITASGGLLNRTPVTATLAFIEPQIPTISKEISPGVIAPGTYATLTININNGAQAVTNLSVTDYFTVDGQAASAPNGMSIAAPAQAATTCPGGIVSATPGDTNVSLSGANLAADQDCQVTVRVTSTTVGTVTNIIPLNAISTDQGATNSTTFAESTLDTTISVGITKQFIPKVVSPNQKARLRINFLNTQVQSITSFGVADSLPTGLTIPASPNPISNCGGNVSITWPGNNSVQVTGGNLGAAVGTHAATCYVEIDVVAENSGSYINTIPGNSMTVGPDPINHPPTTDILEVREPLLINKAIAGFTLDAGNPVGFTSGVATRLPGAQAPLVIRLENTNDAPLTQVTLMDELPAHLVVSTTPGIATSCTNGVVSAPESARKITLTGATLAAAGQPGSSCTITVNVLSNIPGTYTNTIPTGGVKTFEGITNQEPTSAQLIITEPSVVGKQFEPPVIAPNAISRLTIVVNNVNASDMILSSALIDNLPGTPSQMLVATPSNLMTTCPGGLSAVQAAAGSTNVQLNNNAVVPTGGCRIEVDVTASEPGDYLNAIGIGALQSNFGPNEEPAEAPLLVSTLGYISGKVFIDHNAIPDGVFVPGSSTPISGNPIELYQGNSCSGSPLLTTTTDAQGNYLFGELLADTYTVCQPIQPTGTLNSITTEGIIAPLNASTGTAGIASNPASGTPSSQIASIVLNNNGNDDEVSGSPQNNFSEVLPASISGWVYHDRNNNGLIDSGEEGIGSVTLQLTGVSNSSTVTNPDGSYRFDNLYPGSYTVTELHPSGWDDRQETAGSHGGDTSVNEVISNIVLAAGDNATDYNFGEGIPSLLTVSLTSSCVDGAAYVNYTFSSNEPFDSSAPQVDITWLTEDGSRVIEQLTNQPITGSLLWPGTVLSGGVVSAWPGWDFIDGRWVKIADDRVPTMMIQGQIVTLANGLIGYPSANRTCAAQPPGTYQVHAAPTLSFWALALLAALLMFATWLQQRIRLGH